MAPQSRKQKAVGHHKSVAPIKLELSRNITRRSVLVCAFGVLAGNGKRSRRCRASVSVPRMLAELLRRAQAVPVDADFFGGCAGKQQQQQRRRRQRQQSAARTASGLGRLVRLLLKRLLECRALIEKRQRQLQRWTAARQSASGDGKRRIVKRTRTISVHGKYRTGKNDAQLLHFPVLVAGPPFTNPALSAPRRRFFVATAVVYDIRQVVRFCVLTTSRRGAAAEKMRVTVESTVVRF